LDKNSIIGEDCRISLNGPNLKFDYCLIGQPDFNEAGFNPKKLE